jgi:hypothetical protein
VLCAAGVAGAQITSLDRDVKATPGREVRVGIYTSMRGDCTAGPLPAIRLSVAPQHGTVTVVARHSKRPMSSSVWRLNFPSWSRSIGPKRIPPMTIDSN